MKKIVLGLFLYSITAYAAPEGFELISGQVSPPQTNAQGQIHIQSTQDSVVHWNGFSLNPQEVLVFDQAQATSSIVNRVVGSDPSEILGKLQSNGMVYLINPNGILIGPSGVIETAGFLASTLDVLTADFFTKNTLEFFSENPGSIVNLGKIICPIGQITLLAQSIENQGEINGSMQAIACTKATLQIDNQRVFIQTNQELNTESIQSLNTSIQKNPYAHAIKHSGRITANTLGTQGGRVYLFAQEGTTDITGYIEASDIQVLGKEVLLQEQAIIDASSDTQGGKVLIGGSYKGQDPNIPLAKHALIDKQVQIHTDARQTGDGGEIIIWSEENTEFLGSLSAKGGTLSGNGGFAEVSGKRGVSFEGLVDLTAKNGKTGNLLIDPDTINITPGGGDPAAGQTFNTTGTVNISGANIGAAINTANLTLQANIDINIGDDITATTVGNGLTLQAGGNIVANSGPHTITLQGGNFSATFNDDGAARAPGPASFIASDLTISTLGGNITIQQGNLGNLYDGYILFDTSNLNAVDGLIELTINSNNSSNNIGISTIGNNMISGGNTFLQGTGAGGISFSSTSFLCTNMNAIGIAKTSGIGIQLKEASTVTASTGEIVLNGQGPDSNGIGISIEDDSQIQAVNNSVTLNSTLGSVILNDGRVLCKGSGVLTVNTQTDCILRANQFLTQMEIDSGLANFTIGRDLVLVSGDSAAGSGIANALIVSSTPVSTGGLFQFDVGRDVFVVADTSRSFAAIGYGNIAQPVTISADIIFHHVGGNLDVRGANSGTSNQGFAQIGHLGGLTPSNTLNGNISLLVDGSIFVSGGSSSTSSYAQIGHGSLFPFTTTGQLTAIAGEDILMQSNAGSANIINRGGDVILVADNLFPTAPLIGPGFFSINSNLSASGQLRIYTAMRSQNQINDLINGAPFIPGTLFVNTNQEMWATYYPGGNYGGGPFTFYYKDGTIEAIEDTFEFIVSQTELSTILPIVDPPIYQAKLDYFFQRELRCFDPYRRVLRYRMEQKNLSR